MEAKPEEAIVGLPDLFFADLHRYTDGHARDLEISDGDAVEDGDTVSKSFRAGVVLDVEGFARVGVIVGGVIDGLVIGVFGCGTEDPSAKSRSVRERKLREVKEVFGEARREAAYVSADPVSMKRLPV